MGHRLQALAFLTGWLKSKGFRTTRAWVEISKPSLTGCVILSKRVPLSGSCFAHRAVIAECQGCGGSWVTLCTGRLGHYWALTDVP